MNATLIVLHPALQEECVALKLIVIYAMTQTLIGAKQGEKTAGEAAVTMAAAISLSAEIAGASMTKHATAA